MGTQSPAERLVELDKAYEQGLEGEYNHEVADAVEARVLLAEEIYGPYHPDTLRRMLECGRYFAATPEYKNSLNWFVPLRNRTEQVLYANHPLYVQALLGIVTVWSRDGRAEDTIPLYREAITRYKKYSKTSKNEDLLQDLLDVSLEAKDNETFCKLLEEGVAEGALSLESSIYYTQKLLEISVSGDGSLADCERLIRVLVDKIADEKTSSSDLMSGLKAIRKLTDNLNVERLNEAVIRLAIEKLDPQDPEHLGELVNCHTDLSSIYVKEEDFELAQYHYEAAMHIFNNRAEGEEGKSHTSRTLGELAYVFGKLEDSSALLKNSLERALNDCPNNEDTAEVLHNLGTLALAEESFDEAEDYLKNALDIRKSFFGQESAEVQLTLLAMGILYGKTERISEGERCFQEALKIEEVLFGVDSEQYQRIQEESYKLIRQGIKSSETKVFEAPVDIPDMGYFKTSGRGATTQQIASEEVEEETPESEESIEEAEEVAQETPELKDEFRSALIMIQQGKLEDAVSLLEILLDKTGEDDSMKELVLENLADACFSLGDNKRGQEYLKAMQA